MHSRRHTNHEALSRTLSCSSLKPGATVSGTGSKTVPS